MSRLRTSFSRRLSSPALRASCQLPARPTAWTDDATLAASAAADLQAVSGGQGVAGLSVTIANVALTMPGVIKDCSGRRLDDTRGPLLGYVG